MKVLMINVVCGTGSTGRICADLAAALEARGHEVKIAYGRKPAPDRCQKYAVKIGSDMDVKLHGLQARLYDGCGFGSRRATEKFIGWLRAYDPDVIHLHNLHGYYINIEVLFRYLRTCGKKLIWTLHDCWAFTGHAAYCEGAGCVRWTAGCYDCPKKREYPASFIDRSRRNWEEKRRLLDSIPNLLIVTPSEWLADLVRKSFLAQYALTIIHNGVDTDVFKPEMSRLRDQYRLGGKKVVLGAAAAWSERKGLKDFFKLRELLDDTYQIMLIGLTRKQIRELPDGMTGLTRTDSVERLVQLYNTADVFFNPTYEDNYPSANLEAIACGTPVITYDTGGSGESARMYGRTVKKADIESVKREIERLNTIQPDNIDVSKDSFAEKYLRVYEGITEF